MGHESSVTRAVMRACEDRERKKTVKSLKALLVLVFKDWPQRCIPSRFGYAIQGNQIEG